jgi:hypothetical protein
MKATARMLLGAALVLVLAGCGAPPPKSDRAWILWSRYVEITTPSSPQNDWDTKEGFDTSQECHKAKEEELASDLHRRGDQAQALTWFVYQCLPDTVNPNRVGPTRSGR